MAERRRQEIWNRINRIGVSLHELADEIQALAAELKTEEGEDFAEFSMDDFTRDFAHALQNMAADEESEWSSPSSFSDDDVEEEQPIATEEQNWEPVGEGLAFSQDDLIAALAEVKPEAPEALAEEPVATAAPEEQPVATSVYLAAPENETQSIDDILATLKPSAPEVAAEVATTPVAEVARPR